MHHFHMSYEDILWQKSYRSLCLLALSVPSLEEKDKKLPEKNTSIEEFIKSAGGLIKEEG